MPIQFGTSGWRGIIADDFTFDGVRVVSRAIAESLSEEGKAEQGVVVGYDTRFLSEAFARAAVGVLTAQGVPVFFCSRDTPTPVVGHEIRERKAAGGVIITASHNPPEWNGLKFSGESGGPALPAVTERVEARANIHLERGERVTPLPREEAEVRGLFTPVDPAPAYRTTLSRLVDFSLLRSARLSLVCDTLYGTGRGYLDAALRQAGCELLHLHETPHVLFGGHAPDPSAENLRELSAAVRERRAHLGLATDGDADRYGVVDTDGTFIEPNDLLALLLKHLVVSRGWRGGVARSVATSHLVDAVAARYGVEVYETRVGFKYLGDLITQGKVFLAGEESAGLALRGHVPEKDGILACLLVAEMVAASGGKPIRALLTDLYREVGTILSRRINLPASATTRAALGDRLGSPPDRIAGRRVTGVVTVEGTKFLLEDGAWILLRPSGTEPVVRLYVEARSEAELEALVEAGKGLVTGQGGTAG